MKKDDEEKEKEVIGQGRRDSSSRFKSVHWDKRILTKWRARGTVQGNRVYIGCYDIEEDAARAHQGYLEHGTLPARQVPTSASRGIAWSRKGKV
jgi:hypothetical protein